MAGYEHKYSFFEGYYRAMKHMSDEQELEFRRAIDRYAFDGELTEFSDPVLSMAWDLIITSLEKSMRLSSAGKKGGRGNKKPPEKGALEVAFKPAESLEEKNGQKAFKPAESLEEALKPPFNEIEVEEEKEIEKENARAKRLLSFYNQRSEAMR